MSYNTDLQTNNTSLEEILETINNLPEESDGVDTSDATATASDILSGKTAYVKGTKITGNIASQAAKTIIPTTTPQVAVLSGRYTTGAITVQGDSNLKAENIAEGVSIFGVTGTHSGGGSSGESTDIEDSIITRTITTYTNDRITTIGGGAFHRCINLTSVNFPKCTSIGSEAFYSCSKLTSVSFPVCTSIETSAFYSCTSLTSVNFPKCTTIGLAAFNRCLSLTSISFPVCTRIETSAFYSCTSLTSVNFPVCSIVSSHAFEGCSRLTDINFPKCSKIGNYAFGYCTSLTSVNFPVCSTMESYAFYCCSKLTSVSFPVCTKINGYAFYSCSKLTSVSFPVCTSIGSYAFRYCASLTTIYLGASSICTLAASNAFSNTGIWSNKGYIYVPSSLYSSYKTATNWVFFSKRIFSYTF